MPDSPIREELASTVAARRELGPSHDDELIDGFLERLGSQIDRRSTPQRVDSHATTGMRFVMALVSLGTGIPITAIALSQSGFAALAVCWAGIVLVNLAFASGGR